MTHSDALRAFVAGWEECRLVPYYDEAGVLTCGYGHTGPDIAEGDFWTQQMADLVLDRDLRDTGLELWGHFRRDPTQEQFDALVSLAFNVGADKLGGSGTMARFNAGLLNECADRFPLWNKVRKKGVLVESNGLTKRRLAERDIFLHAQYGGRP